MLCKCHENVTVDGSLRVQIAFWSRFGGGERAGRAGRVGKAGFPFWENRNRELLNVPDVKPTFRCECGTQADTLRAQFASSFDSFDHVAVGFLDLPRLQCR